MRYPIYGIFIILMLAGNLFAAWKLWTDKADFIARFPSLQGLAFECFRIIPVLNIVALGGLWFFRPWAAWAAILLSIAVIALDIIYHIRYHLPIAIVSAVLLLFFLFRYREAFR